ncbi:hypothetical protein Q9S71_12895 [Microbacterium sp. KSW4-11]|uniref:Integral membrane protein n=1 Tax=Microbacterium gawkjiense TaxID=3067309 RepID=A0ABU3GF99_9MICO|nr:hypothetical protein [Microbacterium sp. KSW4-11]MDT3317717.1 hypothetical protein [Microbacterium sp. KSW4-11]
MRPSRLSRVARGGVAASVATWAALLSHVAAGGAMPGWLGVAVPLVLSFAFCTALAGRHLSVVRLAVAVTASQLLFHTLFVVGAVSPSGAAHAHHLPVMMDAAAPAAMHADPLMWAMHGVAALLTVAVLHRGERAARRLLAVAADLARWARRRILAAVLVLGASGRPALAAAPAVVPVLRSVTLRVADGRGPPRALTI